ncbi:MAG: HAD hydrolase-like protein, partial [Candidatus Aenigmatarchaeota archaeon]
MKKKLVLFDIDGILALGKNEAHHKSFSVAIKKIFNIDIEINEIQYSGKTDTRILLELLERKGFRQEDVRPKLKEMFKIMIEYVKKNIKNSDIYINPGVVELLEELKSKGYILGLITGNVKEIAKIKLGQLNLWKYFQVGGFGNLSEFREDVLKEVIAQAEKKSNLKFDKKDIFYFGDAPLDMICGKNVGVTTIGVSTGMFTIDELAKYKPSHLFKDYYNTDS